MDHRLLDALREEPRPLSTFPHAPEAWTPEAAAAAARAEGLALNEDHWELLRALQGYYARQRATVPQLTELKQALEEKYHHKGGVKYLYTLFPGGPVAQGCRLAGLTPPAGAIDKGFGSVA